MGVPPGGVVRRQSKAGSTGRPCARGSPLLVLGCLGLDRQPVVQPAVLTGGSESRVEGLRAVVVPAGLPQELAVLAGLAVLEVGLGWANVLPRLDELADDRINGLAERPGGLADADAAALLGWQPGIGGLLVECSDDDERARGDGAGLVTEGT
jgi:hypothetical protein